MSSAVVSFSDRTLMQLFKRSHHGARGSLSTPLPLFFDFSISFFSMFAFPSGLGKVWIGLWCLPESVLLISDQARGMKDVSMDGTAGTKARLMPCSGSAVHAPEVRKHVRHPRIQRAWSEIFSFLSGRHTRTSML